MLGRLLPSFFIVGPPRTGTTWLYQVLKTRVILPRSVKETRFFDVHFHRGVRWYQAHYPLSNSGRRVGEIAPTYFASRDARERIKGLLPAAKIVCIFRNPVERVISLFRMKRAYGFIPWDFEEALLRDPELVESSRYATYLAEWREAFGSAQVLPMFYDDLCDRPQLFVDRLADFTGIPRFVLTPPELRVVYTSETMTHPRNFSRTHKAMLVADWLKSRRLGNLVAAVKRSPVGKLFLGGGPRFTKPSREMVAAIWQLFRNEVEALEGMVGRDLSAWKPEDAEVSIGVANREVSFREGVQSTVPSD